MRRKASPEINTCLYSKTGAVHKLLLFFCACFPDVFAVKNTAFFTPKGAGAGRQISDDLKEPFFFTGELLYD
jgi:hypothetical protein